MALLQNPIFLAVVVIILIGLLIVYRLRRTRKKQPKTVNKSETGQSSTSTTEATPGTPPHESPFQKDISPGIQPAVSEAPREIEEPNPAENGLNQMINPDINLIPDVILKPGEETILLILPELVPMEEVKKFEEFLRRIDSLKIVTTGGSSEEGSNIGIRILTPVNLTAIFSKSNMSIMKHLHKKGERIVVSLRP
jgi:hypothetical protein